MTAIWTAGTTELAEWDWVVTSTWKVLHHMALAEDAEDFETNAGGEGVTSCGVSTWLGIPGLGARMGAPRCKRCCRRLGFPEGVGSPKNDDTCRRLVKERLRLVAGGQP